MPPPAGLERYQPRLQYLLEENRYPLETLAPLQNLARDVLLPARAPGVRIEMMSELSEVRNMLAERVIEWTQEWKQQGLEEGREEGHKELGLLFLQELLTEKFGPLDAATLARLPATDSETLLVWGKRVLNAKNPADVFQESAVH